MRFVWKTKQLAKNNKGIVVRFLTQICTASAETREYFAAVRTFVRLTHFAHCVVAVNFTHYCLRHWAHFGRLIIQNASAVVCHR